MSGHGSGPYKRWSGKLSQAQGRNFTEMALPFLRAFWPSAKPLPEAETPAHRGVSVITGEDSAGHMPAAVLCLGFSDDTLGDKHAREVAGCIERFRASSLKPRRYLVIHNRDGSHREFEQAVDERLRELVSGGRVQEAALWQRQTFLNKTFERVVEVLSAGLRRRSDRFLKVFENLFELGVPYIPEVPVTEEALIFQRGERCIRRPVLPRHSRDVPAALLSPDVPWTLLTGIFGTGKTLACLHAARSSGRTVIFVPCAMLSSHELRSSANLLFEHVVRSLGVLEEYEEPDRRILEEISGAALASYLRRQDTSYTLIFDALDESAVYCDLEGMQLLNNQLVGVNCPIVMTTRKSHLKSLFGHFSIAFRELSSKLGRMQARLLELERWDQDLVVRLVREVAQRASGENHSRLTEFLKLVERGEYVAPYGDLPSHPLFLQFILEDVAREGVQARSRTQLLRSWVERKIWRDRNHWIPGTLTGRVSPDGAMDTDELIRRMLILLENVAARMTQETGSNKKKLLDSIDVDDLRKEADAVFGVATASPLAILLNSVLIAPSERHGMHSRIVFAFRILQEYFLASYFVRENYSSRGLPKSVRELYFELKALPPEVTGRRTAIRTAVRKDGEPSKRLNQNKWLLSQVGCTQEQVENLFWRPRTEWPKEIRRKVNDSERERTRRSRANPKRPKKSS